MRALHIIDNLASGGTQNLAVRTMRSLSERGIDVQVCVLGGESNVYAWQWLPPQCRFLGLPRDYRKPWHTRRMVTALRAVIHEQKPDILHSWLWLSDFMTARANPVGCLPHISHIVDRRTWQESRQLKHKVRRGLTRRAFERSRTHFLAVSHAARQFAIDTLELDAKRIQVAWNSIDVDQYAAVSQSAFFAGERTMRASTPFVQSTPVSQSAFFAGERTELVLGMASRLEPEKGHAVLLDALAEFRSRGGRARLLITGQGEYRKELQRQIVQLHLSEQVEFVGFVESVKQFLTEVDVFLVPSVDSEGLPTTILEAMAAGRAVIASDVGGATEAIRHQVDGLIVPARNATALADAIEGIANDPSAARAMCESARQRVQECFSMTTMMKTVVRSYMSLTKQEFAQEPCS